MQALTLRPYQNAGTEAISETLLACHTLLYVLPTGGGKTVVFTYIAQRCAARGMRVLILSHREELIGQTSRALLKFDVHHGLVIAGRKTKPAPAVQVASVQTLGNRLSTWPAEYDFDLIIVDEAHHTLAGTYRDILKRFARAKVIGVTATPCRTDGSGLGLAAGGIFEKMIVGPAVGELIKMGFLVRPTVYAPSDKLDLAGLKRTGGDISKKDAAKRVDKASITGDAVAHYTRLAHGTPCVVFCTTVAHANHVAAQFAAAGYRAVAVSGKTEKTVRKKSLDGLGIQDGSGRYLVEVVATCDVVSEGTDIPSLGCGIMLRPTLSLSLFLQQAGRLLRVCDGKERAVLLDHVGNVARHGMPDDERNWSLDGVPRATRKQLAALGERYASCPDCLQYDVVRAVCACGHVFVTDAPALAPLVPVKQEDLIEIGLSERAQLAANRQAEINECDSLEKLQRLARRKGWPHTWAQYTWNERLALTTPRALALA